MMLPPDASNNCQVHVKSGAPPFSQLVISPSQTDSAHTESMTITSTSGAPQTSMAIEEVAALHPVTPVADTSNPTS